VGGLWVGIEGGKWGGEGDRGKVNGGYSGNGKKCEVGEVEDIVILIVGLYSLGLWKTIDDVRCIPWFQTRLNAKRWRVGNLH